VRLAALHGRGDRRDRCNQRGSAYMQIIVGFMIEAFRRLGDAMRSRFGDRTMKIGPPTSYPWLLAVLGVAAWFALWAAFSYKATS
jgi:hypothetical protein